MKPLLTLTLLFGLTASSWGQVVYQPQVVPVQYQLWWVPSTGILGRTTWTLRWVAVPVQPQRTKTADTEPVKATDWPFASVADIKCGDAGGSACLVALFSGGKEGLCISAAHVCENSTKAQLTFPDGYTCTGRVIALDQQNDLAAIRIPVKEGMTTPRCVRAAKLSDGVVTAVGYPFYSEGESHWTQGKVIGYSNSDVKFSARPFVHSGFSGGALFSEDGAYLGSTNGYGTDYSYAASGPALEKFCKRWMKTGVGE